MKTDDSLAKVLVIIVDFASSTEALVVIIYSSRKFDHTSSTSIQRWVHY